MSLTELALDLFAKASRVTFGRHSGAGLFGEFEARKDHLHQEVQTDRRGRTQKRWVRNDASKKSQDKPRVGMDALGNMPALFGPEPKTKKPGAEAPLFNFDFGKPAPAPAAVAPTPAPEKPADPRDDQTRHADRGRALMVAWQSRQKHRPKSALSTAVMQAGVLSSKLGAPTFVTDDDPPIVTRIDPGDQKRRYTVDATDGSVKDNKRRFLAPIPDAPLSQVSEPQSVNPAPGFDYKGKALDGSLTMTQDEHRAWNAGVLQVGSTKIVRGKTYRLNDHHRWALTEADPAPAAVAPTPEPGAPQPAAPEAPDVPRVTQHEYDAHPDKYGVHVQHGHTTGMRWQDGVGTVSGPVVISDRDRPLSIQAGTGYHAQINRDPTTGVMTAHDIRGSRVTPAGDGQFHLHIPGFETPVHLTDNGHGTLTVTGSGPGAHVAALPLHEWADRLHLAMADAQAEPDSPDAEGALRAAVKNFEVAAGTAPAATAHTPAPAGDTPAPAGQAYLVGLPEHVTDAQRVAWNTAAERLITELHNTKRDTTLEERQLLARYSGNGGIGSSLNEYYTPPELGKAMWEALKGLGSGTGAGLEPSSGPGVMAQFAPADARMDLVELSPVSAGIANALFGHRHDVHSTAFERFAQENPDARYDFMVGNPPFGPRDENAWYHDDYQDEKELARYFTLASLDRLKEGGVATFVLPAGIARNKSFADFRARIAARAQVLAIHGLPTDTFSRAGTEAATTDVWVLRGRPEEVRGILDSAGVEGLKAAGIHDADFIAGKWHEAHPEQMHAQETQRPGMHGILMYARDGTLTPEVLEGVARTPNLPSESVPGADELLEALKDNPRAIAAYLKKQRGKEGDTRTTDSGQLQICRGGRWHNLSQDTHQAILDAKNIGEVLNLHATMLNHGQVDKANAMRAQLENVLAEYVNAHGNPHHHPELQRHASKSADLNNLLAAVNPDGTLAPHLAEDAQAQEATYDPQDPHSVLSHLRRKSLRATMHHYRAHSGHATDDEAAEHLTAHGLAFHPETGTWMHPGEFFSGDSNEIAGVIARGLSASQPAWVQRALEAQAQELKARTPVTPISEFDVTPRDSWVPLDAIARYFGQKSDAPSVYDLEAGLERDSQGRLTVTAWKGNGTRAKFLNKLTRYLTGKGARADEQDDYDEWDEGFSGFLASQPDLRERVEQAYAARGTWLEPTWQKDSVQAQIPGWQARADGGLDLHAYQDEAIHRSLAQGGGIIAHDVGLGKTSTALAQCFLAKERGLTRQPMVAVPKSVIGQWRQEALKCRPGSNIMVIGAAPRLTADGQPVLDEQGQEIWDDVTGAAGLDRQLSRMKTGNFDLVLITHKSMERIQYDPQQQLELIQDEFYDQKQDAFARPTGMSPGLYAQYAGLKAQSMIDSGELTLADLQSAKERLDELNDELRDEFGGRANKDLSSREAKDKKKKQEVRQRLMFMAAAMRALSKDDHHPLQTRWDELGVDHLVIDEAQNYKGLWTYSKSRGSNVKYLGAPAEPSMRALDLYYKTRAMRDANNGRGVYLLSATPLKNSPVELYSMLSYTAPQLFKRLGIHNLDQFVQRYCRIEPIATVNPDTGEVTQVPTLVGLKNLGELRREAARYINRKTAQQVGLKLPHNDEQTIHIEPRPEQAEVIKWVAQNPAEAAAKYLGLDLPSNIKPDDKEYQELATRYMLALPHITRRAELDMEMLDPHGHKGYVSPKVEHLLEHAARAVKAGEKSVIFCDVTNMPNPDGGKPNPNGYSFHEKLARLISERTGVPREKIALVNADTAPSGEDRLKIANGLKDGTYQIVIGNTGTMGEGINLQHGVANLLHLDVPWNPAIWQQRVGRVVRQGNTVDKVNNTAFLGTRGLDKDMFDTLSAKGVWYDEFWNGESDTLDSEGQQDYRLTPERLAVLAIDDPAEREAAMKKIMTGEAQNRDAAQRTLALKQFKRYRTAFQAVQDAERRHSGGTPTPEQAKALTALRDSRDTLRERLTKNPHFAPYLPYLDRPSSVLIDPGSGKAFEYGQMFRVKNASGGIDHISIRPKGAKLEVHVVNLLGHSRYGYTDRTMKPSDLAALDLEPYDREQHVRDAIAGHAHYQYQQSYSSGRYGTQRDYSKTNMEIRQIAAKHPQAIRDGLRDRDATSKQAKYRLVLRDGQVTPTLSTDVQPTDHYLVPGNRADAEAVNAYLDALHTPERAGDPMRNMLREVLGDQQFSVENRYDAGRRGNIYVRHEYDDDGGHA